MQRRCALVRDYFEQSMTEKQTKEYKSIRKIRSGDKGFKDLSVTCVALANAQGGTIYIGIEDETKAPLPSQIVEEESEIAERLPDVELRDLRNIVYKMVGKELASCGGRTYRRYELIDGRKEKK